jgi:mannosyltransferase
MKEDVKKLDLGNIVIFTGNVTNVNEWLHISDLFLFASKKECFPSVIIQAMATGLPVISLPLPNIIEFIIENQKSGIIIDNIENAVQTALRLVNNVSEYKRISLNAIKRVHECFTDEIIMSAYHNLYDSI